MAMHVYLYDKSKYTCDYGDPYGPVSVGKGTRVKGLVERRPTSKLSGRLPVRLYKFDYNVYILNFFSFFLYLEFSIIGGI